MSDSNSVKIVWTENFQTELKFETQHKNLNKFKSKNFYKNNGNEN